MKLKLVFLCLLMSFQSFANEECPTEEPTTPKLDSLTEIAEEPKKETSGDVPKNKANWVILPVLASTPANGFMFGVAPAANWIHGDPSTTSISSMLASVVYTTLKQVLLTMKGTAFWNGDKYMLMFDWRYFITSQPTYGLGTGPQSQKMASRGFEYQDGLFSQSISESQFMKFDYLRFRQTFFIRGGKSRFFYGLGYNFDYHYKIVDQLLKLDTTPPVITSHYAYSKDKGFNPDKYTTSGLSFNGLYDSRDNTINPYNGLYAFASLTYNPTWLGSSKNSSLLWLEFRDYFHLSEKRQRTLLAFWAYSNLTLGGEVPYLDLPAQGWDQYGRSGRGYPQGRFRGENLIYSEVEFRFPLQREKETWGAVIFVNTSTASNKSADIPLFKYTNPGAGAGLRWMVNKKSRTNVCLDYGFGSYGSHGFYLSVNEVF